MRADAAAGGGGCAVRGHAYDGGPRGSTLERECVLGRCAGGGRGGGR